MCRPVQFPAKRPDVAGTPLAPWRKGLQWGAPAGGTVLRCIECVTEPITPGHFCECCGRKLSLEERRGLEVPAAPVAAVAQVAAPAPVAPVAPVAPHHSNLNIDEGGMVTINGKTRQWKDLTPAEKADVRRSLAEARAEISKINQEEIQREVREAMNEAKTSREEMRRELAEARAEVDEAMREIDAHSAELRRSGQDPEQLKATVRASLKAVEAIDVEAITRQAMASVDPATINAAMAAAQAGLAKAEAELERAERDDD